MRICILTPGDPIKKSHKSSSERFIDLLAPQLSKAEWVTIHCLEDELPLDVKEFDAYLITGGKYSVFEDFSWQNNLFDLIRKIYQNNIPVVGVCYGHQVLAHALDGQVERFDNGWGVGVTSVNITNRPDWLEPTVEKVYLLAMHQDQVTKMPTNATRFLGNHFCHISGFYIEDRVLAIQQHPEFTPELCRDLILKRKERIGERYESALQSLEIDHQGDFVGQWIANFICQRDQVQSA